MKYVHQHLEVVDSTNEALWELSEKIRLSDFHALSADFQTKGKGQDSNIWESEPDSNILLSFVVYPNFIEAGDAFQISRWVSLSILHYLEEKGLADVKIKWPNDIYVGKNKIAGILIQNAIAGANLSKSMIGIGLNINQLMFITDAPNPISLSQLTELEYDVLEETNLLMTTFMQHYSLLEETPLDCIQDYHKNMYQLEEWSNYLTPKGQIIAKITGVDEFGRLVLVNKFAESEVYDLKEIKFL